MPILTEHLFEGKAENTEEMINLFIDDQIVEFFEFCGLYRVSKTRLCYVKTK